MEYDGQLVSELGVKKYLQGRQSQQFTNLKIMERTSFYQKRWDKCNMGCHVPSYRRIQRDATMSDFIKGIDKISPVAAGIVDGMHASTIKQAEILGAGVQRTGEGLSLGGKDKFKMVGAENMAALNLLTTAFKKVLESEIDYIDNPLTKLVMAIVYEYIGLVPESLLVDMVTSGAIKCDSIDENFIYAMMAKGVVKGVQQADIKSATSLFENPAKKLVAKQVGKKLGVAISALIAAKITKTLMRSPDASWRFKKRIASMRKVSKGGGVGALLGLLKAQGWLGTSADASRELRVSCPKLWVLLRHKLNGSDMLLFVVKNLTKEYIDRISLIEKSPATYLRLMKSLINEGKTEEILFPR